MVPFRKNKLGFAINCSVFLSYHAKKYSMNVHCLNLITNERNWKYYKFWETDDMSPLCESPIRTKKKKKKK